MIEQSFGHMHVKKYVCLKSVDFLKIILFSRTMSMLTVCDACGVWLITSFYSIFKLAHLWNYYFRNLVIAPPVVCMYIRRLLEQNVGDLKIRVGHVQGCITSSLYLPGA